MSESLMHNRVLNIYALKAGLQAYHAIYFVLELHEAEWSRVVVLSTGKGVRAAAVLHPGHAQDACGRSGYLVCQWRDAQQRRILRCCRGD